MSAFAIAGLVFLYMLIGGLCTGGFARKVEADLDDNGVYLRTVLMSFVWPLILIVIVLLIPAVVGINLTEKK